VVLGAVKVPLTATAAAEIALCIVCPAAGACISFSGFVEGLGLDTGKVALPTAFRSATIASMSLSVPGAFDGARPDVALCTS